MYFPDTLTAGPSARRRRARRRPNFINGPSLTLLGPRPRATGHFSHTKFPPPRVGSLFCSAGCISLLLEWCVPDSLRHRWFSKETTIAKKIYRARARNRIERNARPRRAIPASTATIGAKCMTLAYTPRISRGRIFHLWSSASAEVTASAARLVFMLSTPRNARLMLTPRKELIRRIVLAVVRSSAPCFQGWFVM